MADGQCTSRSLDLSPVLVTESEDSGSDSQSRSQTPEPQPEKQKLGAAKYRTKYSRSWAKECPFITSVPGDPYRLAIVNLCALINLFHSINDTDIASL